MYECVTIEERILLHTHLRVLLPARRIRKRYFEFLRVVRKLRKLNLLHLFRHIGHHDLIAVVLEIEVHVCPEIHCL